MTQSIRKEGPCPCGSGKTYGECCYQKQKQIVEVLKEFNQIEDEEAFEEHFFKCMELKSSEAGQGHEWGQCVDNTWNIESVEKMETAEIIEKLHDIHIQFNKDKFIEQAQSYISAEKLADDFYYTQDFEPEEDEDFIWLAITELWKRLLPDKVNVEMIDDAIFFGYDDAEDEQYEKALEKWKSAWEMMNDVFSENITSTNTIMEMGTFSYPFSEWLVDYGRVFIEIGMYDKAGFERAIEFIETVFQRFPDIDKDARQELLVIKAESLGLLGNREEAETLIRSVIEQTPDRASAYAVWGNMYWGSDDSPPDYEKAQEIYELGLSRCKEGTDIISCQMEKMDMQRDFEDL
jgi:tetratricopeptide (TPR) repeat protein